MPVYTAIDVEVSQEVGVVVADFEMIPRLPSRDWFDGGCDGEAAEFVAVREGPTCEVFNQVVRVDVDLAATFGNIG